MIIALQNFVIFCQILIYLSQQFYICINAFHKFMYNTSIVLCVLRTKLLQSCLSLCNAMNCSPSGSLIHEILQARVLEWVAMPSSISMLQLY